MNSHSRTFEIASGSVTLRPMQRADAETVRAFAENLPVHDLLFLQRDIRNARVVDAWLDQIESGLISSMVAVDGGGELLACTALVRDELSWSPHVGEIRIVISLQSRGGGLGRLLASECVQAARIAGIEKLFVRMTPDQQAAIRVFEDLGFQPEALLREHVREADGRTHDILILALNLARQQAQQGVFGLGQEG
ncbi:MAG: N-acetyltransferase family protein [Novosphingobium sp.]